MEIAYQPVGLTFCIAKTIERMAHDRLYNFAEKRQASENCSLMRIKPALSCKPSATASKLPSNNTAGRFLLTFNKFREKSPCLKQHIRACRYPLNADCAASCPAAQLESMSIASPTT